MRGEAAKLAVVLCGLAGVVYAADQSVQAPRPDINQLIAQQLVSEGKVANAAPNAPGDTSYTPVQMLILAPKYTAEIQTAIERAEDVRVLAYRSHDIIRMACADDKIGQMKSIRSTNPVADGTRGRCYLDGEWSPSKPRVARLKTLASSRC